MTECQICGRTRKYFNRELLRAAVIYAYPPKSHLFGLHHVRTMMIDAKLINNEYVSKQHGILGVRSKNHAKLSLFMATTIASVWCNGGERP